MRLYCISSISLHKNVAEEITIVNGTNKVNVSGKKTSLVCVKGGGGG